MTPCAGNNTVAALLAGAVDAEAAHRLEIHLDACATCRQLVADLGRGLSAIGDGARGDGIADRLPRIGEHLGRYEIRRVIGVGGMGVVYEAHDSALDRRVAVKLLRPDIVAQAGAQLLGEAKAMARLQHPNIAVVHDVGLFDGQLYVCMELVTGATLRDWLSERSRSWRELLAVFVAAGRGLAYVHRAGLVHLDFKPDNVLVCRSGRVVVTDFGLARMIGGQRPPHGPRVAVGTPAYMAPEQRRGDATDARTDQFGFCAALREALGDRAAPAWLRRAIARGTAPRSADRFASMEALLAAFELGEKRPRQRVTAVLVTASAAVLAVLAARPETTITRIIDRPVVRTVIAPRTSSRAEAAEAADAEPASSAALDEAGLHARDSPAVAAVDPGVVRTVAAPAAPRGVFLVEPSEVARSARSRSTEPRHDGDGAAAFAATPGCDDGTERVCLTDEPACPASTVLAVQDGCWTCADPGTCASLGLPRLCNDGSRLTCTTEPPVCAAHQVAAVRNGCWRCEDAFTCAARSSAVPKKPAQPPSKKCGNGSCEAGEDRTSCPADCGTGSNGGGGATCGNGFCEVAEDHASCAADCCELTASGSCAATCGNGFCETGEDHASCASDCCETTSSGACAAHCGNGFCEEGEDAQHCPGDCP